MFAELSQFVRQPLDLRLRSGETAMLACSAAAKPEAVYSWTRDGVPLSGSDKQVTLHSRGQVLEIHDVLPSSGGQYRCRARNMAGELTSSYARLTVVSPGERERERGREGESCHWLQCP